MYSTKIGFKMLDIHINQKKLGREYINDRMILLCLRALRRAGVNAWGGHGGVCGGVDFLSQMARGLLELLVLIKGCGQWCTGDRVAAECISNCTTCATWDLCKYFVLLCTKYISWCELGFVHIFCTSLYTFLVLICHVIY